MEHNSMTLPYAEDALEPVMSKKTIGFHFGKHYQTYLDNAHKLIATMPQFQNVCFKEIMLKSDGALFNNVAQVVNHEMFFKQFTGKGKGVAEGALLEAIKKSFESFDEMKKIMTTKSVGLFGSGWVWLAMDGKNLVVVGGSNAYNPLIENMKPLLAIDVWEHSYYLDYQNRRAEYIENLWKIIDWNVVSARYKEEMDKCDEKR